MAENGAPALVVVLGVLGAVGGHDLPAGVLELDAGRVALGREAHLEPGRARGVVARGPGHRELRRRLPDEHAAPPALAPVGVTLVDPPADLLLDDDLGDLAASDRV